MCEVRIPYEHKQIIEMKPIIDLMLFFQNLNIVYLQL